MRGISKVVRANALCAVSTRSSHAAVETAHCNGSLSIPISAQNSGTMVGATMRHGKNIAPGAAAMGHWLAVSTILWGLGMGGFALRLRCGSSRLAIANADGVTIPSAHGSGVRFVARSSRPGP